MSEVPSLRGSDEEGLTAARKSGEGYRIDYADYQKSAFSLDDIVQAQSWALAKYADRDAAYTRRREARDAIRAFVVSEALKGTHYSEEQVRAVTHRRCLDDAAWLAADADVKRLTALIDAWEGRDQ